MVGKEKVKLKIIGRKDDYWLYTLRSWFEEVKDIIENEYNIELDIIEEYRETQEHPIIVDEKNEIVIAGVPGEPGHLIEELKLYLDKRIKRDDERSL
ncbi:MAG TPA: hypothetical protein EYP08_07780 [Pyrodictiaceae archaeon]|nr:hypothetical protein [Pyrodictiaceae archaeon]HIQ11148.1 hypothetical protein [Pyrodictium sp.]HIQ56142.1 hypothetical protein [Pyrodictium sp.]